jgi:RNA polymerase sigma factor (sigma-70 family)
MAASEDASHLSRISTRWDDLAQAHEGHGDAALLAQQAILRRYCGAIYRYLMSMVHDADTAEELSQEFALRFVRGSLKGARPDRGRFRDFVKRCLSNLVADHYRQIRSHPLPLGSRDAELPAVPDALEAQDDEFTRHWRGELLGRAWEGLAADEARTGRPLHTVLHWRVEHPGEPAAHLAEDLQARLDKPFTESGIRVILHRARQRFADLLLEEVARSLRTTEQDRIEQELIDLDLLTYCRPALGRRASG